MKTAMILAAGRGERLRPLTDTLPKAMFRINDKPLIEYHIENLAHAGFKRVVINHAYLGDKIRQHLGNGARFNIEICYSPEPPGALETGGAITNALPLLGKEPFVTVNADIFTDYNFASFKLPSTSSIHLVLVEKPHYETKVDFGLSGLGKVLNTQRQYIYGCIAAYRPELFSDKEPSRFSVTPLLRDFVERQEVTGEIYKGLWYDIGTEERLSALRGLAR